MRNVMFGPVESLCTFYYAVTHLSEVRVTKKSLKKFGISPPIKENFEAFLEWSKRGPKVYSDSDSK